MGQNYLSIFGIDIAFFPILEPIVKVLAGLVIEAHVRHVILLVDEMWKHPISE
jgi:hypothetical protein